MTLTNTNCQSHRDMITAMEQPTSESDLESDEQLMLAYGRGEFAAFEVLYKRHKDPVFRYLLRQGVSQGVAEELMQDVWSKVIKARQQYSIQAKFNTWLYRIARNCLIDHFRASKDMVQLVDEMKPLNDEELSLDSEEQLKMVRETIVHLPFPQRQALLLHYEAGMTVKEVAEVTEEHPEAVKSSLRYAIKKLSRLLRPHDA